MMRFRLLRLSMDCRNLSEKTRFALSLGNVEGKVSRV